MSPEAHKLTILVYAARQKQECLARVEGRINSPELSCDPLAVVCVFPHLHTCQTHINNSKINQLKSKVNASLKSHLFEVVFLSFFFNICTLHFHVRTGR